MDSEGLLVADHDSNKQPFIEGSECCVDLHQHPRQPKLSVLRRIVTLVVLLPCLLWISIYATDPLGFRKKHAGFDARRRPGEDKVYYDVSEECPTQITPSEKLQWHPCFPNFGNVKCARLTVPMDYNRPLNVSQDNPKVHIFITLIPGAGHEESGKYSSSPLLVNPGGPGGPGASFAIGIGASLQKIVSSDATRDIIGFDPRGVGWTTPGADCWSFPSNGNETTRKDHEKGASHRITWWLTGAEIGLINETESALAKRDQRARAANLLCKERDNLDGENSILRHVSTPAVAQDMLSIIDAWDVWRAETGQDVDDEVISEVQDPVGEATESTYSLTTKSKLVYWGFSYGTLLGATFAAMFPDRVGRVALDGVVDADLYVSPAWAASQSDADAIQESFYYYCVLAGDECMIYRPSDTPASLKVRVEKILENLKKNPVIGISPYSNVPLVFQYSTLKSFIFGGLYSPMHAFDFFAKILDAVYTNNTKKLLEMIPVFYPMYPSSGLRFPTAAAPPQSFGLDAQLAIMCTDKRYPLNESLPALEKRYERMANVSQFADVWMGIMIGCSHWNVEATDPPMRWDNHPSHRQKPINTSFPLLFLSNTHDPVTPLEAGVKMAGKFVDAGLVESLSQGHCSIATVSLCMLRKIRQYFEDGVVPPSPRKGEWTRCEADEWPWKPFQGDRWMEERMGVADDEMTDDLAVQRKLVEQRREIEKADAWRDVGFGLSEFMHTRGLPL